MTCVKQEFCIHEKYCQRHIGQNFDSCILFSRNSKPMTNEEWIHTLNTEQLADVFYMVFQNHADRVLNAFWDKHKDIFKKDMVEWLKQPHTFE